MQIRFHRSFAVRGPENQALHKGHDVPRGARLGDELSEAASTLERWHSELVGFLSVMGLAGSTAALSRELGKTNVGIEHEAKALLAKGGPANARVYITYEHEQSQRDCLDALSVGVLPALLDLPKPDWVRKVLGQANTPLTDHFHGNVLRVTQAPEPTDVRWENLDVEPINVFLESCVFTCICMGIVAVMGALIKVDPAHAAITPIISSYRGCTEDRWGTHVGREFAEDADAFLSFFKATPVAPKSYSSPPRGFACDLCRCR